MLKSIKYPSITGQLSADLYIPPAPAGNGAIVIAYGSDGLTNDLNGPWKTMIGAYADALVGEGFVVLVPYYLEATGTPPGPMVLDLVALYRDSWQRAISDAVDYARSGKDFVSSRI